MKVELDKENCKPEPVIIFENGWYFIAKNIGTESEPVYEIDKEIEYNGFGELKDLMMYYYEKISPAV